MIVFNLRCAKDHIFEAWFRDSATYDDQVAARKVACPACGSKKIAKAPMAPNIATSRESVPTKAAMLPAEMMSKLRELRTEVEKNSDHVGDALNILKATGAQLVSTYEVCVWLSGQGVENANFANHGGTVDCDAFTTSIVQAVHSSSADVDGQITYLGNALVYTVALDWMQLEVRDENRPEMERLSVGDDVSVTWTPGSVSVVGD